MFMGNGYRTRAPPVCPTTNNNNLCGKKYPLSQALINPSTPSQCLSPSFRREVGGGRRGREGRAAGGVGGWEGKMSCPFPVFPFALPSSSGPLKTTNVRRVGEGGRGEERGRSHGRQATGHVKCCHHVAGVGMAGHTAQNKVPTCIPPCTMPKEYGNCCRQRGKA